MLAENWDDREAKCHTMWPMVGGHVEDKASI